MRKHFFLAIVLTALFLTGKGQQVYFDSVYQIKNCNSSPAWCMVQDNNSYVVAGVYTNQTTQYWNIFLMKLDSSGNRIWEKYYGDSLNFYSTGLGGALILTHDSCYVLTGKIYDPTAGKSYITLTKFDRTGDTIWMRKLHCSEINESMTCKQTPDRGFIILGSSDSTDTGSNKDMTLIKTDSTGIKQWQRYYHKIGNERAMSIDIMKDNGFLIGGWRNNSTRSAELFRTDSNGYVTWSTTFTGGLGSYGTIVKCLKNGNYLVSYSHGVSNDGGINVYYQIKLILYNNLNQTIWTKSYGHWIKYEGAYVIRELKGSDFAVLGTLADSLNEHISGFIIKVDTSGNQKYFRLYDHLTNLTDQNYLYDFDETKDGGFVAAGFCLSSGNPQYSWVVRVDSMGCQYPGCNVMVNELEEPENKILLYPNPAQDELNISVPFEGPFTMEVYSTDGQLLISKSYSQKENVINLQSLKPSLYMLNVKGKTKSTTAKFVKT